MTLEQACETLSREEHRGFLSWAVELDDEFGEHSAVGMLDGFKSGAWLTEFEACATAREYERLRDPGVSGPCSA